MALGALPLAAIAADAPPPPADVRPISNLQAAQLLMQGGKVAEAKTVLLSLEQARGYDPEVLFLLGLIAVQENDYPTAERRFRAILVHDPKAVRVRLELARAFFLAKDWDNAERQFRFARAGDVPPPVAANIDRFLAAIRQQRTWSQTLAVGLAPDTNLNAGPSVDTIDIYGLPFQLSPDAQKHSGIGVAVDAAGEWSPHLSPTTRLRIGGQFHRTDYSGKEFDDMTAALYAGPTFVSRRWEISPLVTGFRRWYGGAFYNQGLGGALQAVYYASAKLGFNGSVGAQQITYGPTPEQGGPAVSGSLGAFYVVNPATLLMSSVAVTRQNARLDVYANTARQVQVGVNRDLPGGLTVSVQPSFAWIDYDAALAAFGVKRSDRQFSTQITLLSRRIDIRGFTPRLSWTYTHNASSIPLYAYSRSHYEIGLTRTF